MATLGGQRTKFFCPCSFNFYKNRKEFLWLYFWKKKPFALGAFGKKKVKALSKNALNADGKGRWLLSKRRITLLQERGILLFIEDH